MREWLKSIQVSVDKALVEKKIDPINGKVLLPLSDPAAIGRLLLCSVGQNYNCTGRVRFLTKIFLFYLKIIF